MPTEIEGDLDRAISHSNIEFSLTAYAGLRHQDGNLFFSPYSICSALAMAYAGARGVTQRQMAEALHLPSDPLRVHAGFAALNRRLRGDGQDRAYKLSVANAVWGARGVGFRSDFLTTVETAYDGKLAELEFARASEAARATINQWVEAETENKIKDLLSRGTIAADTLLILTNAIYFKADWADQFDERLTKQSDFMLTSGQKARVPLMEHSGTFGYVEGSDFQALEMPYAGAELAMVVILPRLPDGPETVEKALTVDKLSSTLSRLSRREVLVQMPKFKLTESLELSSLLSGLGMPLAFSGEADFSGMAEMHRVFFSAVVHKAYVDVDEKGTEAAAATAVVLRGLVMRKPVIFRADHPFLVLIRD